MKTSNTYATMLNAKKFNSSLLVSLTIFRNQLNKFSRNASLLKG
jgi:hypothetical protein